MKGNPANLKANLFGKTVATVTLVLFAMPLARAGEHFFPALVFAGGILGVSFLFGIGLGYYYGGALAIILAVLVAVVAFPFGGALAPAGAPQLLEFRGSEAIWWAPWFLLAGFVGSTIGGNIRMKRDIRQHGGK